MAEQSLRRRVRSRSPEQTFALGVALGQAAQAGDLLLLEGDFGAGKTVLVQGLAAGLEVPGQVTSPSFVLVHQHDGRLPLFHVDLYRAERLDLELEETVADAIDGEGVTAVEWPELLPPDLIAGASRLRIRRLDDQTREIELQTPRPRLAEAFRAVEQPTAETTVASLDRPRRGRRSATRN